MGDDGSAPGNERYDHPAWRYLLVGGIVTAGGAALVATGAMEDSRRALLPWFLVVGGLLALGAGIREWSRNGSPTARRRKSAEEQAGDAASADRARRWRRIRLVGTVVVAALVVAVLALG